MPLYYFNIFNDDAPMDQEATQPADNQGTHMHGVTITRGLASDTAKHGHIVRHNRIEITDADREPIASVRFDEAIEIRP